MKTKVLSLSMFLIGTISLFAQSKTEKFKVYGSCNMCKTRIEAATASVEGVTAANWNEESEMISVSFDTTKTDLHKIHMAIAKAGHDTDLHKANNETYNKLPTCCQYVRPEAKQKNMGHEGHNH